MKYETDIKVTRINKRYHARLFVNGDLYDEMACEYRTDVGFICRQMLRNADKMGVYNAHTESARKRITSTNTHGKIWYRNKL